MRESWGVGVATARCVNAAAVRNSGSGLMRAAQRRACNGSGSDSGRRPIGVDGCSWQRVQRRQSQAPERVGSPCRLAIQLLHAGSLSSDARGSSGAAARYAGPASSFVPCMSQDPIDMVGQMRMDALQSAVKSMQSADSASRAARVSLSRGREIVYREGETVQAQSCSVPALQWFCLWIR